MNKIIATLCSLALLAAVPAQAQDVDPASTRRQTTLEDAFHELDDAVQDLDDAVKRLEKLRITGFVQAQYQYAQPAADGVNFRFPRANGYEELANYPGSNEYKGLDDVGRFGLRRSRLRFAYHESFANVVFQLNISERGVGLHDAFVSVNDLWCKSHSFLRVGVFDRPFGYEISYPSWRRESPERSRIFQTIFPDERDVGAMLTLQAGQDSPWSFLRLDVSMFSGNGIRTQYDTPMDFIGRLTAAKVFDNVWLSGGVSVYLGGVRQMDSATYVVRNGRFELESKQLSNIGKMAKRQYVGFNAQVGVQTVAGETKLKGEYIFGEHPGDSIRAYEFRFASLPAGPVPPSRPAYMRKLRGGYVVLTQDVGKLPFCAVLKYDWYNPNTMVSGNAIAAPGSRTGEGDVALRNMGFGLIWRINTMLHLTAYYDMASNETTENLGGYEGNRDDNVFTLRLQYRF